jgi:thiol:disulfide interchange protein DsbD
VFCFLIQLAKKIKTIGNKWSDLQIKTYKANAQPYYVIVDHNSTNLTEPSAYNPDIINC